MTDSSFLDSGAGVPIHRADHSQGWKTLVSNHAGSLQPEAIPAPFQKWTRQW